MLLSDIIEGPEQDLGRRCDDDGRRSSSLDEVDFRLERLGFCVECLRLGLGELDAAPARFVSSL